MTLDFIFKLSSSNFNVYCFYCWVDEYLWMCSLCPPESHRADVVIDSLRPLFFLTCWTFVSTLKFWKKKLCSRTTGQKQAERLRQCPPLYITDPLPWMPDTNKSGHKAYRNCVWLRLVWVTRCGTTFTGATGLSGQNNGDCIEGPLTLGFYLAPGRQKKSLCAHV